MKKAHQEIEARGVMCETVEIAFVRVMKDHVGRALEVDAPGRALARDIKSATVRLPERSTPTDTRPKPVSDSSGELLMVMLLAELEE